ncbi:MAG: hypothetical protein ACPG32_16155 [Akkermansiaceae bacterium]
MKTNRDEKIQIELPASIYHALRNEAKRQGIDLPQFIRKKINLKPMPQPMVENLARLPLREILAHTEPERSEDRLDFFS